MRAITPSTRRGARPLIRTFPFNAFPLRPADSSALAYLLPQSNTGTLALHDRATPMCKGFRDQVNCFRVSATRPELRIALADSSVNAERLLVTKAIFQGQSLAFGCNMQILQQ